MKCIDCQCDMTKVDDIKRTYYTKIKYRCSGCRSKGSMVYNVERELIDFKWKAALEQKGLQRI